MTTAIEVIDTAVKIGLGAIISGVATYWVTNAKNKHDLKKTYVEDSIKILRETAEYFDQSKALLNDFVHHINKNKIRYENNLMESYKISSRAHALANLIGQTDLALAIKNYSTSIHELYQHTVSSKHIDAVDVNSMIDKTNDLKNSVEPLLSAAYARIIA